MVHIKKKKKKTNKKNIYISTDSPGYPVVKTALLMQGAQV